MNASGRVGYTSVMTSLRWALMGVCALALGCDGSTSSGDAGTDSADPNACGCSAGLAAPCAADASTCPPDLGTPAFDAWAEAKIGPGNRPPHCVQATDCPELLMVVFGEGVDCASEYLFDAVTKKLVALAHTCDGYILGGCTAASTCIPQRCLPSMNASYGTPASCPALPDAGPVPDASADAAGE